MSYLASIYLAALALAGALLVWALPALLMAFVGWARDTALGRKPSGLPPEGSQPAARRLPTLHVRGAPLR